MNGRRFFEGLGPDKFRDQWEIVARTMREQGRDIRTRDGDVELCAALLPAARVFGVTITPEVVGKYRRELARRDPERYGALVAFRKQGQTAARRVARELRARDAERRETERAGVDDLGSGVKCAGYYAIQDAPDAPADLFEPGSVAERSAQIERQRAFSRRIQDIIEEARGGRDEAEEDRGAADATWVLVGSAERIEKMLLRIERILERAVQLLSSTQRGVWAGTRAAMSARGNGGNGAGLEPANEICANGG